MCRTLISMLASGIRMILGLLLLVVNPSWAGEGSIVVVSTAGSDVHRQFVDNITVHWPELQAGTALPANIYLDSNGLLSEDIDPDTRLIITVGSSAARAIADLGPNTDVLNTLLPESAYAAITRKQGECPTHSAVYIDQPLERQGALADLLFPGRTRYGLLLGPVSSRRHPEIDMLQARSGHAMAVRIVQKDESTMAAGRDLLSSSDLLLAVNDPLIMNRENAKWLLYVAYQKQLPVIGFSRAYVRAGAAAAVYSDLEQLARQVIETVNDWDRDPASCLSKPQYPVYFRVAINTAVSKSLGGIIIDEGELERLIRETTIQ